MVLDKVVGFFGEGVYETFARGTKLVDGLFKCFGRVLFLVFKTFVTRAGVMVIATTISAGVLL